MSEFSMIKDKQDQYVMHTYSRFDAAIISGKGATAHGADGRTYIDFGSGIGVNALGYCDEGWCRAIARQANTLTHTSNLYYTPVQAQLGELICGITGFDKVFYCNSGAEANEGIIKLARKYSFDRYGTGRATVVTLYNSFHGRTITTLAATGQESFHQYFFPFTEGFRFAQANDLESVKAAFSGDVCAILLEAVQGEGGICPLEPGFVEGVAALAKEQNILLLFDEVQTGIGRTGRFFAYEHFGVSPDAVSCAKALAGGLPMGAVLCTKRLADVLGAGTHATTFGGNPIACAGAIEVLTRVSRPEFLQAVTEKGEYLRKRLAGIPGVGKIRGLGLMLGFEIEGIDSRKIADRAVEKGLLLLTAKSALRMLPPLVITREEIDRGADILTAVIEEIIKEGVD